MKLDRRRKYKITSFHNLDAHRDSPHIASDAYMLCGDFELKDGDRKGFYGGTAKGSNGDHRYFYGVKIRAVPRSK